MSLDAHIGRVEEYGLNRRLFPLRYNGHVVAILNNDAYIADDDRLLFDFSLYCMDCEQEGSISGRFPADYDDQLSGVAAAKVAVFENFKYSDCV